MLLFFFLFKVRRISTNEEMTEALMPDWINRSDIFQDSENYRQENCGMSKLHRSEMISQCIDLAGQTGKAVTAFCITIFFFLFLLLRCGSLPFAQADLIDTL